MPIISETRAPVLYIMLKKARSRWPAQLDRSGASMMAMTSDRERKPTNGRSNRLNGIANARSIVASDARS
tara:strand:- start:986 stop:1195 length:210 start_codon:yes stop_codon:yes gene_type:complete